MCMYIASQSLSTALSFPSFSVNIAFDSWIVELSPNFRIYNEERGIPYMIKEC